MKSKKKIYLLDMALMTKRFDELEDYRQMFAITEEALKNAECLCMTIEERCSDGDIASVSRNFYIPIFEEALAKIEEMKKK